MASIAISVLWFLVGLIVLCGVVYLAIWVIESFVTPIPAKIKQGVWVIILLLALIALITAVMGGGGPRFPSLRGESGGAPAAVSAEAARHLPRVLVRA